MLLSKSESTERTLTLKANKPRKNVHPALRIFGISRDIICILAALIILATVCCFAFGYKPAVVLSGSMEPTIETGSIALIDTKDKTDIKKGDIIAFTVDNTFITHRVTRIDDEGIHTKDDGNETADLWVIKEKNITGKTVFWIPKAGYIASWLTSKQGMIIVIGLCAALIIASFLDFSPKDEEEKKKKKKAAKSSANETSKPASSTNETNKEQVSHAEKKAGEAKKPPANETEDAVSHVKEANPSADEKKPAKAPDEDEARRVRRDAEGKLYIGKTYIPETKEEFQRLEKSRQAEVLSLLRAIKEKS